MSIQCNKCKKIFPLAMVMFVAMYMTSCGIQTQKHRTTVENLPESTQTNFGSLQEEEVKENGESSPQGMIANAQPMNSKNTYDTLNVATYITKVNGMYFIADCYHNQIIYHDNLADPLEQWNVLTDEVHYAHTIASDGTMLLLDDTENNRLLAFQQTEHGYVHTQTLDNIGMRPHFVQYDEKRNLFLAWSSITGELYLLKRAINADEEGRYPFFIENILKIDSLYGVYVRSFSLLDDEIYFVSGHNNQEIIKAVINDAQDSLDIVETYRVSPEIAGMVQLSKIGNYYYITVSTDNQENQDYATIIRTKELESLENGEYEDIYAMFGISGGTPYYITEIEGRYYMAHHRTSENILAFDVKNDLIKNVTVIY